MTKTLHLNLGHCVIDAYLLRSLNKGWTGGGEDYGGARVKPSVHMCVLPSGAVRQIFELV